MALKLWSIFGTRARKPCSSWTCGRCACISPWRPNLESQLFCSRALSGPAVGRTHGMFVEHGQIGQTGSSRQPATRSLNPISTTVLAIPPGEGHYWHLARNRTSQPVVIPRPSPVPVPTDAHPHFRAAWRLPNRLIDLGRCEAVRIWHRSRIAPLHSDSPKKARGLQLGFYNTRICSNRPW